MASILRRCLWTARDAALGAAYYTGLTHGYAALAGRREVVLSYHNVLPPEAMTAKHVFRVDTARPNFESQLAYLARRWPVRPAAEIGPGAGQGVFLTFDDGMRNAYTTIAPALEQRGMTGMFAVCPALVDGAIPHIWRDHVYLMLTHTAGRSLRFPMDEYDSPRHVGKADVDALAAAIRQHVLQRRVEDVYALVQEMHERNGLSWGRCEDLPERFHPMTWDEIRDLADRGHVIASHTQTHRILSLLSRGEKQRELAESKARLEAQLGREVKHIVYPYGGPAEVDEETSALAAEWGYEYGFVNQPAPFPGPPALARGRLGLPNTSYRPHLHAVLCGLKHRLRCTRTRSQGTYD